MNWRDAFKKNHCPTCVRLEEIEREREYLIKEIEENKEFVELLYYEKKYLEKLLEFNTKRGRE